jgi:hypothetical protein
MAGAAATAWHTYLTADLTMTGDAATYIESYQGWTGLEDLIRLDAKQITAVMDTKRKTRTNPIDITANQEKGLIDTMYYVKGMLYVSRAYNLADITRPLRQGWGDIWKTLNSYTEPTEVPDPKSFPSNWVQAFEQIDEYFRMLVGDTSKVPLYYIVRPKVEVKDEADDDPRKYASRWQEMCTRMPHWSTYPVAAVGATPAVSGVRTLVYNDDNKRVWDKLSLMFKNTEHYAHMKPHAKSRDGRGAYMALYNHYLGENNTANMAATAEVDIAKLRYVGEKRRYNFDTYVNAHKRLHNVFDDLKALGHDGLCENAKVRRLMQGIHNRHLDFIKSQIISNRELYHDFDKAVMVYKDFILQSKHLFADGDHGSGVTIGAVDSRNKRKFEGNTNWDTSDVEMELRHYSPEEYKHLTGPQKLKLKRWRAGGMSEQDQKSKMMNPNHPSMQKMIAMMQRNSISNSNGRVNQSKRAKQNMKAKGGPKGGNRNKALVKQVTIAETDDE